MTRRPRMLNERDEGGAFRIVVLVLLLILVIVLAFDLILKRFVYAVAVSGSSMEDTVSDGDVVYALRDFHAERGDIVIIDVSDDDEFSAGTMNIIKRLIATEGDCVKCEAGIVYVKPSGGEYAALNEPYTKGRTPDFAEVRVGEGEIFFLGDHRDVSHDSTEVGTRPYTAIVGVVPDWAVSVKSFTTGLENFRAAFYGLCS